MKTTTGPFSTPARPTHVRCSAVLDGGPSFRTLYAGPLGSSKKANSACCLSVETIVFVTNCNSRVRDGQEASGLWRASCEANSKRKFHPWVSFSIFIFPFVQYLYESNVRTKRWCVHVRLSRGRMSSVPV